MNYSLCLWGKLIPFIQVVKFVFVELFMIFLYYLFDVSRSIMASPAFLILVICIFCFCQTSLKFCDYVDLFKKAALFVIDFLDFFPVQFHCLLFFIFLSSTDGFISLFIFEGGELDQ